MKLFLSKMSLFGMPMGPAMNLAEKAGFQGIEILVNGWFAPRMGQYKTLAKSFGLDVHYHQAWSPDEDPTDKKFVLMQKAGYLPKQGYQLQTHLPADILNEVVVIQADRMHATTKPNFWIQTDCSPGPDGAFKVPFHTFVDEVQDRNRPVVFDTQHYLEYRLGTFRDLSALPTDPKKLLRLLEEGWYLLDQNVREIHLSDCRPGVGRNLFLGNGILPLREFCRMVRRSGWGGTVVPEVSPTEMFPYRLGRVTELKATVESYFGYG